MSYRLVALDVDGTLIDSRGRVTPRMRAALDAVRERGVQVVLCTGRRFRTARPLLAELELSGPVVVNNGVVVKDIASGQTLHASYLTQELVTAVLPLAREGGPPLVYVDERDDDVDLLTERLADAHPFQQEYLSDNTRFFRAVDDLGARPIDAAILISLMADDARLTRVREVAESTLGDRIRLHTILNKNYQGSILEFLSPEGGKWRALHQVATDAGIDSAEILAIGDDRNDTEMIRKAGLGVAMRNAVAEVRDAADHVTGSNDEDGAAAAIEHFVLDA